MFTKRLLRILAFTMAFMLLVSVAATAFAYSTIPYGEQSDNVRKMQNALKQAGYYKGSIDGKFGPATRRAVIKYQQSVGITADGKPGNKTLSALYDGISSINKTSNTERKNTTKITNPRTLYYGCTGPRVRELQRALRDVGCYSGAIDGVYGDLTFDSVKKFQYQKRLHADGVAGTRTLKALNGSAKQKVGEGFVLAVGSTGNEVKRLQSYLRSLGFDYYLTDKGGQFQSGTEEAVRAWQASIGAAVTGTVTEDQYNNMVLSQTTTTN